MGLELATAFIRARGDASKVAGDLRSGTSSVASAAQGLQGTINGILSTIGLGFSIQSIIGEMREGIGLAQVQIDAEAKVEAIVRGTGMAAGFTAGELKKMASEAQEASTFGDEAILEMQSRLLTFKTVTGEVFEQASKVILNMSATLGTNASASAIQLGRALEDPIRGVSALRRTGVSFSEQQKVYIKQLVESNQLGKAQAFILNTVQSQLGDVAKAMSMTDSGKLKQAKNTLGDLKEELGKKLIPTQTKFIELQMESARALTSLVGWIQSFSRDTKEVAGDVIALTAVMGTLGVTAYAVAGKFGVLRIAMTAISSHPLVAVFTGLVAVVMIAAREWSKYNKIVEEGNKLAGENVGVVESQTKRFQAKIEEVRELKDKEFGEGDEKAKGEAVETVRKLNEQYGGLGIKLNETGTGFIGIAEGINTMEKANKRVAIGAMKKHIAELAVEMEKAKKATDDEGTRLERFGKHLKKTKDIWDVPSVFGQLFKGSADTADNLKRIGKESEEAKNKLKEMIEGTGEAGESIITSTEKVTEEAKQWAEELLLQSKNFGLTAQEIRLAALIAAEADAEAIANVKRIIEELQGKEEAKKKGEEGEAAKKEITSIIEKQKEEVAKLRDELTGADTELRKFFSREGVTDAEKSAFAKWRQEVKDLKDDLKDKSDLENWETKWKNAVRTPLSDFNKSMEEINALKVEGKGEEDWLIAAEEKARVDYEKAQAGGDKPSEAALMGAGSFGFSDFGKQLQNAVLKQDDPQKKIEENTRRTEVNTRKVASGFDKMVDQKTGGNTYANAPGGSQ